MNLHYTNKIAVLLASYNGVQWIEEQIQSIFSQEKVEVTVFVSDDFSNDGSWELLQILEKRYENLNLLPRNVRYGTAGKNFFRLVLDVDFDDFDFVAFSDQDDVWFPDKLFCQSANILEDNIVGISSNVFSFWENGLSFEVKKSQPQKKYDYLFEAPGPGCTFLMKVDFLKFVKKILESYPNDTNEIFYHDWFIYALARATGNKWVILPFSTTKYRQHLKNETGTNFGLKAKLVRLKKIREGWYRSQILKILEICIRITGRKDLVEIRKNFTEINFFNKLSFFRYLTESRRKFSERLSLILMFYFGFL